MNCSLRPVTNAHIAVWLPAARKEDDSAPRNNFESLKQEAAENSAKIRRIRDPTQRTKIERNLGNARETHGNFKRACLRRQRRTERAVQAMSEERNNSSTSRAYGYFSQAVARPTTVRTYALSLNTARPLVLRLKLPGPPVGAFASSREGHPYRLKVFIAQDARFRGFPRLWPKKQT
jgi:hypothetical protein